MGREELVLYLSYLTTCCAYYKNTISMDRIDLPSSSKMKMYVLSWLRVTRSAEVVKSPPKISLPSRLISLTIEMFVHTRRIEGENVKDSVVVL